MSKNKKTVTGWLTRGTGRLSWVVTLYKEPSQYTLETGTTHYRIISEDWYLISFNRKYTCKGFTLKPGDCIFVEMEI